MSGKSFFIHSFFSGHVQGVGFRFQVVSIAKGFDLTGFVRNLDDGRVELLAEGDEGEVLSFLNAIESDLDNYIRSINTQNGSRIRQYSNFSIIA